MRFFILLVALTVSSAVQIESPNFGAYKTKFNKSYDHVEDPIRLARYLVTLEQINEHNKEYNEGKQTYFMGLNPFSDWTEEELDARNGDLGGSSLDDDTPVRVPDFTNMADAKDWRDEGAVQGVKDQGQCGSCWAFAVVGALEGAWAIAGHALPNSSEQELVSCDSYSSGCDGGNRKLAFQWVHENGDNGIDTQASYPYTSGESGVDGTCDDAKISDGKDVAATCSGVVSVEDGEKSLQEACSNQGPIAVGIYCNSNFHSYSGGIYDDDSCSGHFSNHAVLLVGFDATASPPYWIIKNSWGSDWGEEGYFRFIMGKNMCGIDDGANYPLV